MPIGLAVLRDACRQGAIWNRDPRNGPLGVSVNLSARQFQHVGLVADIGMALSDNGLDPALLTLEITESDVMRDPLVAADRLDEIEAAVAAYSRSRSPVLDRPASRMTA